MQLVQNIATHGARAAAVFLHQKRCYLVIPQLARDVPGQAAQMTLGDSNLDAQVLVWAGDLFEPHATLPMCGGEDAEYFCIGEREFLATASLRAGAKPPYDLNCHSVIFEIKDGRFLPFQTFPTFAAKQWRYFEVDGRKFLGLAQGAVLDGSEPRHSPVSVLYEWTGSAFVEFQQIDSAWGYNFLAFEIDGQTYLAYADNVKPAQVYRWNGQRFEPFQALEGKTSRAFCHFRAEGQDWLTLACLHDASVLLRWDGREFVRQQVLSDAGGREFRWIEGARGRPGRLVLVNFILGSREQPIPPMQSVIYRFEGGQLVKDLEFPTSGATDAAVFEAAGDRYLVISNSLSAEVRFATDSHVYRLD
jgi:hypothetical protein